MMGYATRMSSNPAPAITSASPTLATVTPRRPGQLEARNFQRLVRLGVRAQIQAVAAAQPRQTFEVSFPGRRDQPSTPEWRL